MKNRVLRLIALLCTLIAGLVLFTSCVSWYTSYLNTRDNTLLRPNLYNFPFEYYEITANQTIVIKESWLDEDTDKAAAMKYEFTLLEITDSYLDLAITLLEADPKFEGEPEMYFLAASGIRGIECDGNDITDKCMLETRSFQTTFLRIVPSKERTVYRFHFIEAIDSDNYYPVSMRMYNVMDDSDRTVRKGVDGKFQFISEYNSVFALVINLQERPLNERIWNCLSKAFE